MTGTLEQRPFGRTGETVSLIGLGGAALHKHSYQHGLATVKHALDLGIRYFDTSPWYGIAADEKWISEGESQRIMGCLLYTSPSPRDRTRSRMPSSA